MRRLILSILLVICCSARAQISTEEATAKLHAATQPAVDPARDIRSLQLKVEALRLQQQEQARLIKDLQTQIAALKGSKPAAGATTKPTDWKDDIKLGMSEDDVDLVFVGMKNVKKKLIAAEEGKSTFIWTQTTQELATTDDLTPYIIAKVTFVHSKVASVVFPSP